MAKGDAGIWQTMQPSVRIVCASSLEEAIMEAKQEVGDRYLLWTLITGSTYLVGGALALLQERTE